MTYLLAAFGLWLALIVLAEFVIEGKVRKHEKDQD